MKIVQVHNRYQHAGGEDGVVDAELRLLREHGHQVLTYYRDNDALVGLRALLRAAVQTLWNGETYRSFRVLLREEQPDLVHCHNTFPVISPSIYWACSREGVPVVQTLHNYRLLCLNACLFRTSSGRAEPASGAVCERCTTRAFKWPGVWLRCYRDSLPGSFVVALMLLLHRAIGTWSRRVDAYIALSAFQKRKLVEGGLPEARIHVKPNSPLPPEAVDGDASRGGEPPAGLVSPYGLFVGRLSAEKGCEDLLHAWRQFRDGLAPAVPPPLAVVGDGPQLACLQSLAARLGGGDSVVFLGRQPRPAVMTLIRHAEFVVVPSVSYEGFPMAIVEAFSLGRAVIAPRAGSMREIVEDRRTGLQYDLADRQSLARALAWAFAHPAEMAAMGRTARETFEREYTGEVNYRRLLAIYRAVRGEADARAG